MEPEVAPGIRVERDGDEVEVQVEAEIDLSTEPALRRAVSAALRSRPARITLDFCRSSFVGLSAVTVALGALHRDSAAPRVKVRGDRRLQRMFRIGRVSEQVQLEDCPDPGPGGPSR